MNRILWNRRGHPRSHDIDEVVLHDVKTVHIEQMDDRCWWIALYVEGTDRYWMGNFVADSRGRMRFTEQENCDVEWQRDDSHDEPDDAA